LIPLWIGAVKLTRALWADGSIDTVRDWVKIMVVVDLLGLALATAGVHLLARLNALEIDLPRHRIESPYHEPP